MKIEDLRELISNGENSLVEFKRDRIKPEQLAEVLTGLLNHEGGQVLLGVDDNGDISGLSRESKKAEEWVMQIGRDHLSPSVIPIWETAEIGGVKIGIVTVPQDAPDKPYKCKQGPHFVTKIRVGTTTRNATREEEQRLYQQSGGLSYGYKPVLGTTISDLDYRRLKDYFIRNRGDAEIPRQESDLFRRLLCNVKLAVDIRGNTYPTIDGMLLFGLNCEVYLPQSGIRAVRFDGLEQSYNMKAVESIKGPLVRLTSETGEILETGVTERALHFVRNNTNTLGSLDNGRLVQKADYPELAVREVIVNALVHRDYSLTGTDVLLSIFDDRIEVQSPGRLPNSISTENVLAGARSARNPRLVEFMRDYGYVEGKGMGIRRQIIPAMKEHNGSEPEFLEEDFRFTVTLRK